MNATAAVAVTSAGAAANASKMALMAVGQLIVMILFGMLAARNGYITKKTMQGISKAVTGIFTPCLLFSNLSAGTNASLVMNAAVLPVVAFSCCGTGLLCGYIARKTFLKKELSRGNHTMLFQSACIVGNSQGLPLVLTSALVPPEEWPACVSYISMYIVSVHIVTWFGVYNWLKGAKEDEESSFDEQDPEVVPLLGGGGDGARDRSDTMASSPSTGGTFELYPMSPYVSRVKESFNPPLVAVFLGLAFGCTHVIHHNFARPGAPLQWIHTAIARVGQGMVPCTMTIMGSSMWFSFFEEKQNLITTKSVVVIALIRLCILPMIGVAYALALKEWMPAPLLLTILVEAATPTANNVTVILAKLGIDPVPLGNAYIMQYAIAIPLYAYYLAYALQLAESSDVAVPTMTHP